jgi:hypothetical protein
MVLSCLQPRQAVSDWHREVPLFGGFRVGGDQQMLLGSVTEGVLMDGVHKHDYHRTVPT